MAGVLANRRTLGLLILSLASIFFAVRGFHSQAQFLQSRDFKPLYAAGRCILHNKNPYDDDMLRSEYIQAGGDTRDMEPLGPHYLLYPPPALVLVLPFAFFSWPAAHLLFLTACAGLLIAASFLVADLCISDSPILLPVLISIFLLGANQLMILAQPAGPAIGLCVIGAVLLLRQKHDRLAVLCFSMSLILKPHLGAMVWLYFFITRKYRSRALAIAAITVLFCLPVVLWFSVMPVSAHWVHALQINLRGTELKGGLSDPGPGNPRAYFITTLQTVVSLFNDSKPFYSSVTWGICGGLFLLWLGAIRKTSASLDRDVFALATVTCLSMLPIYHRAYDTKLLLLCFPALAAVYRQARATWRPPLSSAMEKPFRWGGSLLWAGIAVVLVILLENDRYNYRLYAMMAAPDPAHLLRTILLLRNVPVTILMLTVLYLVLLWGISGEQSVDAGDAQIEKEALR